MCQISELKVRVSCHTPDDPVSVYVQKKKNLIGICAKCWEKIGDKDWEVGNFPRPIMKELLSDKVRFGDNPVETEFKYKSKEEKLNEEDKEEDF